METQIIEEKKRINFLVTEDFNERLDVFTKLNGGNKSMIIRTFIYEGIKKQDDLIYD
jgi:predicted DNA-binding protein